MIINENYTPAHLEHNRRQRSRRRGDKQFIFVTTLMLLGMFVIGISVGYFLAAREAAQIVIEESKK